MKTKLIQKSIHYNGTQLRPHFIYEQCGLLGNALIAFAGKADVKITEMVDLEDVKANAPIYSENMLHFIGEFFDFDLKATVVLQRLLMAVIAEQINLISKIKVMRCGDDLYVGKKKLSVSIATKSITSTLIHVGLNISSKNTPVPTISLTELKLHPNKFADKILKTFQTEFNSCLHASYKVKGV